MIATLVFVLGLPTAHAGVGARSEHLTRPAAYTAELCETYLAVRLKPAEGDFEAADDVIAWLFRGHPVFARAVEAAADPRELALTFFTPVGFAFPPIKPRFRFQSSLLRQSYWDAVRFNDKKTAEARLREDLTHPMSARQAARILWNAVALLRELTAGPGLDAGPWGGVGADFVLRGEPTAYHHKHVGLLIRNAFSPESVARLREMANALERPVVLALVVRFLTTHGETLRAEDQRLQAELHQASGDLNAMRDVLRGHIRAQSTPNSMLALRDDEVEALDDLSPRGVLIPPAHVEPPSPPISPAGARANRLDLAELEQLLGSPADADVQKTARDLQRATGAINALLGQMNRYAVAAPETLSWWQKREQLNEWIDAFGARLDAWTKAHLDELSELDRAGDVLNALEEWAAERAGRFARTNTEGLASLGAVDRVMLTSAATALRQLTVSVANARLAVETRVGQIDGVITQLNRLSGLVTQHQTARLGGRIITVKQSPLITALGELNNVPAAFNQPDPDYPRETMGESVRFMEGWWPRD